MAVKNAAQLPDRFCADGIVIEETHRSKRRSFGLTTLAPPRRPEPGRGRGRPPHLAIEPVVVEPPPSLRSLNRNRYGDTTVRIDGSLPGPAAASKILGFRGRRAGCLDGWSARTPRFRLPARRSEHGPPEWIDTIEQDLQESMQNCGDSEAVAQATAPLRDGSLSGVPTVLHALSVSGFLLRQTSTPHQTRWRSNGWIEARRMPGAHRSRLTVGFP
jgi:hypothetical protein